MPTMDEWQQALEIPHGIYVDSSQSLANRINTLSGTERFIRNGGVPKTAVQAPEFDPPRNIQVAPVEILAALGRITTPRIDNLADISSTWARIRYIWAIEPSPTGTRMCLSQIAKEIDFHQKGLLSDEMGVGIAYYLISNYFDGTNPIDVDVVLNEGNIPNLQQIYDTKPDYIFEHPISGYILVECKGSQGSDYDSRKQLRRGLEQVPSIELDNHMLRSYVIGSNMSTEGFKTFIVDPPDKNQPPDKEQRQKHKLGKKEFEEKTQLVQAATLYQYIGRFEKARTILNAKKGFSQREEISPKRQRIDFIEEDYIGQDQEFRYSGEGVTVNIYQGIPTHTYESLEREDFKALRLENKAIFLKAKYASDEFKKKSQFTTEEMRGAYIVDRSQHAIRATVIDRDSTVTQIEIKP